MEYRHDFKNGIVVSFSRTVIGHVSHKPGSYCLKLPLVPTQQVTDIQ